MNRTPSKYQISLSLAELETIIAALAFKGAYGRYTSFISMLRAEIKRQDEEYYLLRVSAPAIYLFDDEPQL